MKKFVLIFSIVSLSLFASCAWLNSILLDPTVPTHTLMTGVWEVVGAYDSSNVSILNKINFPATVFDLQSDNVMISTAGPMMMYIVYGGSKYATIASKVDAVFDYSNYKTTSGNWYIGDSVVSRFTIEVALQGVPGATSIVGLLQDLGIATNFRVPVIYHKFMDVYVSLNDPTSPDTMTWELDQSTIAAYNMRDQYGNPVLWTGWPATSFSKCRFVLAKRSKTIHDVIQDDLAAAP